MGNRSIMKVSQWVLFAWWSIVVMVTNAFRTYDGLEYGRSDRDFYSVPLSSIAILMALSIAFERFKENGQLWDNDPFCNRS